MQVLFAIGRVLLVLIFILSGAMKLLDIQGTADQIASMVTIPDGLTIYATQIEDATGMKVPQIMAIVAGIVEVVGGLLIAFNIATRTAAVVLVLFTLVTTFYFHPFWTMTGEAMQNNMAHALKNLSIIGALLIMVVLGSWRPVRTDHV